MDADWERLAHRVRVLDATKPTGRTSLGEGMNWLLDMGELQLEITKYMLEKAQRARNV